MNLLIKNNVLELYSVHIRVWMKIGTYERLKNEEYF